VLIPSLINPPHVFDLSTEISFASFLLGQGHDVYMVDWGEPTPAEADMGLAEHVEQLLIPLLAKLPSPPLLVGYCLGGTLALAAAQLLPTKAVVTIAAPWDFAAFTEDNRADIATLWEQNKEISRQLGVVPMEILQSGFWSIDPERTIQKFAHFAHMENPSAIDAFITVEDWANEGAPLCYKTGEEVFEQLYAQNITHNGQWSVGGIIQIERLGCPSFSIRSAHDRIVPAAASPILSDNMELALGHVGMMVSSKASEQLWQPLSAWIKKHEGT
jgi:polyhydroxyalkanoate synthase